MTSLNAVSTLFGGTAPHGLKELYGETFGDGTSAPNTGAAINLQGFTGKTTAPEPGQVGDGVTWTHIAVPFYNQNASGEYGTPAVAEIRTVWRINPRVGTNTSLFSHGPNLSHEEWPTKIRLNEGYLTPTQWYDLTGGGNPASNSNPKPVGVVFVDPFWTKTTNQTT